MRGMILAAGRGARMGQLTQHVPKPLLKVGDHYLIEYSIFALIKMNIKHIVMNVSYLAEHIQAALGDGSRYGVTFYYSYEEEALETGGGIFQALPLLGDEPFIVLSADVITHYPLHHLPTDPQGLAHLILVENPSYHPKGDFGLEANKVVCQEINPYTFANIGVYRPALFDDCSPGKFRLGTLLKKAIANQQVTGEIYRGVWHNVGRPEDLIQVSSSVIEPIK